MSPCQPAESFPLTAQGREGVYVPLRAHGKGEGRVESGRFTGRLAVHATH